jgi:hypothetical protein
MATTEQAAALTAATQRAQLQNMALVTTLAQRILAGQDRRTLSQSMAAILSALVPLILRQRSTSALISRQYYQAFRILETGDKDIIDLDEVQHIEEAAIRTSLMVTGPVGYQRRVEKIQALKLDPAVEKIQLEEAWNKTVGEFSAAAGRHVINGGREQLLDAVEHDKIAFGWFRTTSADPCYFCAMLASRGPVYKEDSFDESDARFTGPGNVKCHDHCACGFEPVFDRSTKLPDVTQRSAKVWMESTKGKSGAAAILAFRQAWEA